jgi:iron(II)-dependent oxidoreductase
MHTTGLATEPMSGLYEGRRLADALREARRRTLAIYAHLDLEAVEVPCLPTVNPLAWELAHIAWFQEYWCLRGGGSGESSLDRADSLYDSSAVPHDSRWQLALPSTEAMFRYMRDTLDATQDAVEKTPEEERYFFKLALLHEDMHGEALLMTLQTLALPPPDADARAPSPGKPASARDIHFAGGDFMQGSAGTGFSFDNERRPHRVTVAPFAMSSRLVSQEEFAQYLDATGVTPPRYWRRQDGAWLARRFDRWAPIDAAAPMVHVSLEEALGYCRWAGRRLPTEAEWEFAAVSGERDLIGMSGSVWQWTSSPFAPYPGFSPDPYRDYSQPWFHSHYVLRGGSFATSARIAYPRYRNFYLPHRGDPFAGFRTCAVDST